MESDIFHPKLRTHKLKDKDPEEWSCRVAYDLRIVFRFVNDESEKAILLLTVGTHDEIY